jgi:ketosteroid isomerase-like protein
MQVEDPISNPIQVVLKFEELINSGRPEAISNFMTPDGEFIDSLGNRIQGREKLRSAWTGYFKMVPDYSISHSEIFAQGSTVAVFGSAQGTYFPTASSGQGEAGSRAEPAAPGAEAGGRTDSSPAGRREATKNNGNYWKTPASWRAVVKDGRISVWQVYADNEPIRAIMRKHS